MTKEKRKKVGKRATKNRGGEKKTSLRQIKTETES